MKSASSRVKDWILARGDVPGTFTAEDVFKDIHPLDTRVNRGVISAYLSKLLARQVLEAVRVGHHFNYSIRDFTTMEALRSNEAPVEYVRTPRETHATDAVPPLFSNLPARPRVLFPASAAAAAPVPTVSEKAVSTSDEPPTMIQAGLIQKRLLEIAADLDTIITPLARYSTKELVEELSRRVI